MEPIVEVEEEKGEIVEMEFDEEEQFYTVVYFGPEESTSGSTKA